MNIEIARRRYKEVLRVDVITNTQGDFLATHVPFKKLYVTRHADLVPADYNFPLSETEVYDRLITPRDDDQFVLVKGDSGTGKSHLIRWFQAMLMANKPDSEAVLFVRRNDNTLKGTIKQLLEMDEVKNLPDSQMYKKLVNAGASVPEDELKANIFYYYVSKIESDDGKGDNVKDLSEEERDRYFGKADRSHMIALFNNEAFKEMMFAEGGPVDRIYSKFAEKQNLDDDTEKVAGFIPEDFIIDKSFRDDLLNQGADRKAVKFADKLYGDDDDTVKNKLAEYLNTFNEAVIRRCTGLEAGDLNEVFADIRRELFKQGKNLTIFIEDVTSFTGVNSELLDALMTSHSGIYSDAKMCRLNAVVGATEGYYKDNFRDNFKVRVSNFITVPGDIFDGNIEGLYEFFGRYLNTLSLSSSAIKEWVKNRNASEDSYPVHEVKEGKEWDYYDLPDQKRLNLFPFDKRAISFLYSSQPSNQRTPRMLMRNIIEPHLVDMFDHQNEFPTIGNRVPLRGLDAKLNDKFYARHDINDDEKRRLSYFMSVWGDATNDVVHRSDGVKTIAEIPESVYKFFELPIIEGKTVSEKKEEKKPDISQVEPVTKPDKKEVSKEESQIREALDLVDAWMANPVNTLQVGQTGGPAGNLYDAKNDLNDFVVKSIDWLSEGVSLDAVSRMNAAYSNHTLIGFERQYPKKSHFIQLSSNLETRKIIEGFIRYKVEGKKSWNFIDSNDYLLAITTWLERVKPIIIRAMQGYGETRAKYMNYGIAADLYRVILNGECLEYSNVKSLKPEILLRLKQSISSDNAHCKEWNDLLRVVNNEDGKDNHELVLQYYNLPQGTARTSQNFIIDYRAFVKEFQAVVDTGLVYKDEELQLKDPIRQRRNVSEYLKKIVKNVGKASDAEKELIQASLETISKYFDISSIDDIDLDQILKNAGKFYSDASDNHLPVNLISGKTNEAAVQALIGKEQQIKLAIKNAEAALAAEDAVDALLLMSRDPLCILNSFCDAFTNLEKDIERVQKAMKDSLGSGTESDTNPDGSDYKKELGELKECSETLKEVRGS